MSATPLASASRLIALGAIALLAAPAAASAAILAAAEDPLREVPVQASAVSAAPTGPPTPAGGWSLVYGDAFGAPLGTGPGRDNTFFPNNCSQRTNCAGFNPNELEVMNPSAVLQSAEGLKLTCTYAAAPQAPGAKHFICGTVRGQNEGRFPGYSFFRWSPGKGQTLVFQAVARFPPNTDEADPAWWSNGPPWDDTEVDFFEGGGWSFQHSSGWRTDPLFTAWFARPLLSASGPGFQTDPSLAFHTYTFELKPNDTYSLWIDGAPQPWAQGVGPAKPDLAAKTTLILSYGLRTCRSCVSGFTGGSREFDVRSVAVYEDGAHRGVGIENGGLAPGTVIG
ncbi:MAG TPA: hypothetical protein VHW67_13280 [Solirubrobacteraceae bacterium]|jgi:hypothetical protein|nr:hypothetical protein [Solirubrobacteraceae bacterium]